MAEDRLNQINQMRQQFFRQKQADVGQQFKAAEQDQQDVLNRRFAALGQAGSGAQMGTMLKGQQQLQQQRQSAMGDIAGQELQANLASQEAELGRGFQSSEAEKGRGFQSTEAEKARQAQESQFGREYGLKQNIFDLEKTSKLRELDMAQKQQDMDQMAQFYNQALSTIQSPYSADRMQEEIMALLKNFDDIKQGRSSVKRAPVAQAPPRWRNPMEPAPQETGVFGLPVNQNMNRKF
jgi:hypothetical protein